MADQDDDELSSEPQRPRNMGEFARASGLARATVSKYFQDPGSVRPTTRKRIEEFIEKLDYRPNLLAQNQNRNATRTIGVIIPNLLDPFFEDVVRRIEALLDAGGYRMFLLGSHGSAASESKAMDTLRSLRVSGVIIAPLGDDTDQPKLGRLRSEIPVVLLDTHLPGDFSYVGTDNAQSIGLIVSYLCATGSPPCFLSLPEFNSTSRSRRQHYIDAVSAVGHRPQFIPVGRMDWDLEQVGYDAALHALSSGGFPSDTVLCANDRLAIGVLAAAFEAGLRIGPGLDLRVAGHDDHPMARFTCPALTTVSQDYDRVARLAVETVLSLSQDQGEVAVRHLTPGKLVRRRSA
ncbi:LacI family DNA-binding transcriptional regulator [Marinibacterium sp. SX1]|uniref:LacI family DNA-binding transcriptional regulator n=1 Tax=Marinibacterium sp. SX1 TaxID=3388424 RepID=UPI003D16345A